MSVHVLAFDPGKMTGAARWGGEGMSASWGAVQGVGWEMVDRADRWLSSGLRKPDMIVCEEFRIGRATLEKSREGITSMEQTGALRWLARHYGVRFETITAADAKNFSTDEKLKKLGWWIPGEDHARDASRVLLLALVKWYPDAIDLRQLL